MRDWCVAACIALLLGLPHGHAVSAPRERGARAAPAAVPKPSGPLEMTYRLPSAPRVGELVDVEVTVRGAFDAAPRLEVLADSAALAIVEQRAGPAVPGGWTARVTVVPLLAAAAYLTVVATARIDGVEQSRSLVVPIRTAIEASAARVGTPVTIEGERLILLPATERATAR